MLTSGGNGDRWMRDQEEEKSFGSGIVLKYKRGVAMQI